MTVTESYIQTRDKLLHDNGVVFQSKTIATKGPVTNVHFLELGSGEPLILIHGGGSHSSEWFNILKPLSERFHLYVVDRPGCGLTDAINYSEIAFRQSAIDFVGSFMDALGLEKSLIMGQSMGGYFSICFALAHPERVKKLLLIGAPAGMNLWIPFMLRLMGTKGLNRILTKTVGKPSINNLKNIHRQLLVADIKKLPEDYFKHGYYSQLLPGSEAGFLTLLENVLTLKGWKKELYIGDQLQEMKMPVRFIWGDSDAFEGPATGKEKASTIKDQKFEIVEDAGHCPWLDQPDECVSRIVSMLQDPV